MKQNANSILGVSLFLLTTTCTGCVDSDKNLFDSDKKKEEYQNSFPVKDIDPDMDWKTTCHASVNVAINEDQATTYRVRIFDDNPLSGPGNAQLLAEGYASSSASFKTQMDYPATLKAVYILRTDSRNRHLLKYVSIENGQVNTVFGLSGEQTRAGRQADSRIETYSPEKTETEIAALATNAPEIRPNTELIAGDIYKISKGETFRSRIYTNGIATNNKATVIIEGTWNPQGELGQIESGVNIYVMGGGKIIVPKKKTLILNGNSILNVYKDGVIEGEEEATICYAASKEEYSYNAGTITIGEIQINGSQGVIYNCGTMNVGTLTFNNLGARLINQGKLSANQTNENMTLENGCYAAIESFNAHLKQGSSCALYVKEYNPGKHWGRRVNIARNSMLAIRGKAELEGCTFAGPTDGYALIKINDVESLNGFKSDGNIYYEVEKIDESISGDSWLSTFLDALKNNEGVISKPGESPITIPSGHCTGEGNTPNEDGNDVETTPITYTYAFEDNYPQAGDYDFNDIVLNVSSQNEYQDNDKSKIKQVRYKITLSAVGANKQLGAGLRLVGISKSDIKEVEFEGDVNEMRNSTLPHSMFENAAIESKGNEVVIPLFGDAHKVYGMETNRTCINTITPHSGELKTLEVIVKLQENGQQPTIGKNNLDFFIAYPNRETRTEIHLYEFRDAKATANGTIHQDNLDAAGNFTWAICVPNFKYAIERIQITEAYPHFSLWATTGGRNEAYTEWYKNIKDEFIFK